MNGRAMVNSAIPRRQSEEWRVHPLGNGQTVGLCLCDGVGAASQAPVQEKAQAPPKAERQERVGVAERRERAGGGGRAGRIRVVVAEDNVRVLHTIVQMLNEHREIEVSGVAKDGVEAVEAARRLSPDIVLMDLNMPRMNGIEATAELTKVAPKTRVIVLSLHSEKEFGQLASNAGAVAYVVKSECGSTLIETIRRFGAERV